MVFSEEGNIATMNKHTKCRNIYKKIYQLNHLFNPLRSSAVKEDPYLKKIPMSRKTIVAYLFQTEIKSGQLKWKLRRISQAAYNNLLKSSNYNSTHALKYRLYLERVLKFWLAAHVEY